MVEPNRPTETEVRKLSKREVKVRLTRGQVPTAPIFEVIEQAGQNPNLIGPPRMVYRYRVLGYMTFNAADRLMTRAGLNASWHTPELKEIYFNVRLSQPTGKELRLHIPREGDPVFHGDVVKYRMGCRCAVCHLAVSDLQSFRKTKRKKK